MPMAYLALALPGCDRRCANAPLCASLPSRRHGRALGKAFEAWRHPRERSAPLPPCCGRRLAGGGDGSRRL